jgi:hypothetical protein
MAFSIEILSEEDIQKYELPYKSDSEKPLEHRRVWLADRSRGMYILPPGPTGNPAFEDDIKAVTEIYIEGSKFIVILEPRTAPGDFSQNPYHIHWPALLSIWAFHPTKKCMVDALSIAKANPNKPIEILANRSLTEIVDALKEALSTSKEGIYNKYIKSPITVSFGF